jgi:hypothetical protein
MVAPCGGRGPPSSRRLTLQRRPLLLQGPTALLQDSAAARGGGGCGLVAVLSSSCVWRWRRRDGGGCGLVGAEAARGGSDGGGVGSSHIEGGLNMGLVFKL